MRELLEEQYDELMFMDGFDDCIVGVVSRCAMAPVVCYARELVVEKLVEQGMTHDEAQEYHEFNQAGAYMGELTPVFLEAPDE